MWSPVRLPYGKATQVVCWQSPDPRWRRASLTVISTCHAGACRILRISDVHGLIDSRQRTLWAGMEAQMVSTIVQQDSNTTQATDRTVRRLPSARSSPKSHRDWKRDSSPVPYIVTLTTHAVGAADLPVFPPYHPSDSRITVHTESANASKCRFHHSPTARDVHEAADFLIFCQEPVLLCDTHRHSTGLCVTKVRYNS